MQLDTPAPGSLLNIPLVRHMLGDPAIPLVERAIDRRWSYEGLVPGSVAGFNPLRAELYYGARSRLASWLEAPEGDARALNDRDLLVNEVLFAVHDHLHGWARLALDAFAPELDFGVGRLAREDLERWTFCLLLTEAAATVGLDYWFLSQVELCELVPIGTAVRNLTTSYRQIHRRELHRFDATLDPSEPGFFGHLAEFYCTGEWPGLSVEALRTSPVLRRWLEHELSYGATQRSHTRAWLLALLGEVAYGDDLAAPVACDQRWQRRLIAQLQEALWHKVHGHEARAWPRRHDPDASWSAPSCSWPDFRFSNLNAATEVLARGHQGLSPTSLRYLLRQLLSRCDFAAVEPEQRRLIAGLLSRGCDDLAFDLLTQLALRAGLDVVASSEPRDLFFLS
ncbi:hypothetical protein [Enhygromyxa salina]|nr:hypothetical protein [Enhygromyxa salina]